MVQVRVRRNGARILAAASETVSALGWSGVTLAGVGKAAGLTIRPVRDRYPTRALLGADTWTEVAGPALDEALRKALAFAGLLEQPADALEFAAAMEAMARPSHQVQAAAELVVVSCFEEDIRKAIDDTLVRQMAAWVDPEAAGSPARAARRGYLLALGLGLIATRHRPGLSALDLTAQWDRLLAALSTNMQPSPLPSEPRPPFLAYIPFDTGDDKTDDLLRAAIDHLGKYGYEASLLTSIAADAGLTEATIYLRYPSKEAFFVDAINRHQDITFPGQRAYLARLERAYGVGIAEAVVIRDTFHPAELPIAVIEMERMRLIWHRPHLAAAEEERLQTVVREVLLEQPGNLDFADPARLHLARAMGLGISFLPLISQTAWDLPYDVVTIPLNAT